MKKRPGMGVFFAGRFFYPIIKAELERIKRCSLIIHSCLDKLYPSLEKSWKQQEAKMKKIVLVITLLVSPLAADADWDWSHGNREQISFWRTVDSRMDRLYHRIENGIRQGDLTRREAMKLKRTYRKLDRRIAHMRHNRWLSRRDKREIMADLDMAGSRIYRLKHNGRVARHGMGEGNWHDRHHYGHADGRQAAR